MSFSLSFSGHVDDVEQALAVEEVLRSKGAEVLAAVRALGAEPSSAQLSGPSGFVNLLVEPIDVDSTEVEADLEE